MKKINTLKKHFNLSLEVPADKSISHRALIFSSLAQGESKVANILESEDVISTKKCLQQLGTKIIKEGVFYRISPQASWQAPSSPLDCGNSGTTMRLLLGALAGQNFSTTLVGDNSLSARPMKRVTKHLEKMGGQFVLTNDNYAPVKTLKSHLESTDHHLNIASAQIKSAILLAALRCPGVTTLKGEIYSRNHTENLLQYYGVDLQVSEKEISLNGLQKLQGRNFYVPGDISSAAFWIVAALIVPHSQVLIRNVGLNSTRTGLLHLLKKIGVDFKVKIKEHLPEPYGDIEIKYQKIPGFLIDGESIPELIDEIPILALLATQAHGKTIIRGAQELRVKECDRLDALEYNLKNMGIKIDFFEDGFCVEGPQKLNGAQIKTFDDHRIAMTFAMAGLIASGATQIEKEEVVAVSYPHFFDILAQVGES